MFAWLGPWADQASGFILVGMVFALGVAESYWPARAAEGGIGLRWCTNLGLHAVNSVLAWVVAPAVLAPILLRSLGVDWHPLSWLQDVAGEGAVLAAGFLLIDFEAYAMHWLSHAVHPLWRLHAVHHSDVEMDVSTALRHHPVESFMNVGVGAVLFAALGIPLWVASIYGVVALVASLVQHANSGVPGRVDRAVRAVLVTPGMHRAHHSVDARDHDANYGLVLSVWDHLFGTCRVRPACDGGFAFGVEGVDARTSALPHGALLMPLRLGRGDDRASGVGTGAPRLG